MAAKGPFKDKAYTPDEQNLRAVLGNTYPAYEKLLALTGGFAHGWAWAKYSGWTLKMERKGKALLYLLPGEGGFEVSMALREAERDTLLTEPRMAFAAQRLENAKKYREGYHVTLALPPDGEDGFLAFVEALAEMR